MVPFSGSLSFLTVKNAAGGLNLLTPPKIHPCLHAQAVAVDVFCAHLFTINWLL